MPAETRVLIVDDHIGVAEALLSALGRTPQIVATGVATDIAGAVKAVAARRIDIVLMDVALGDEDGIQGIARVLETDPSVRVIVYTAMTDPEILGLARQAGASAVVSKTAPLFRLANAIRTVAAGRSDEIGMYVLVGDFDRPRVTEAPRLTARQYEILVLMRGGFDARAMAQRLGISLNTARSHVKAILAKLGAHSQLEAVARATRLGMFHR